MQQWCEQNGKVTGGFCLCVRREAQAARPLDGLSILDVGCGGGLFSEALARLGATVTGIDASEAAVAVAQEHALADPLLGESTSYRSITAEQATDEGAIAVCNCPLPLLCHWLQSLT